MFNCLIAREAPVLEIHPKEPQQIREGESAMLSCRAIAGIPYPTVSWRRKDGRPMSNRFKLEYDGTYILNDASREDAGEYECYAENIAGKSALITSIDINQVPTISLQPGTEEITLTEGDELKVHCMATGYPKPSIYWEHPRQNEVSRYDTPQFGTGLDTAGGDALLQIYNVQQGDAGVYICHAKNSAGEEEKFVLVNVNRKRGDVGKYSFYVV